MKMMLEMLKEKFYQVCVVEDKDSLYVPDGWTGRWRILCVDYTKGLTTQRNKQTKNKDENILLHTLAVPTLFNIVS